MNECFCCPSAKVRTWITRLWSGVTGGSVLPPYSSDIYFLYSMKTILAVAIAFAVCVQSECYAQSTIPNCPSNNGTYYLQGAEWVSMDSVHAVGFKTTNVAGAAFSYGLAKAGVKAQFRDAQSPYQLKSNALAVCLVGVTDSGRDITVAKFQEEKNRRELPMASYRLWTGVNAQLDPKVVVPITIEKKSDKVYLVTSKDLLHDGEFILFTIVPDVAAMVRANTATSLGGYDFGIHRN